MDTQKNRHLSFTTAASMASSTGVINPPISKCTTLEPKTPTLMSHDSSDFTPSPSSLALLGLGRLQVVVGNKGGRASRSCTPRRRTCSALRRRSPCSAGVAPAAGAQACESVKLWPGCLSEVHQQSGRLRQASWMLKPHAAHECVDASL